MYKAIMNNGMIFESLSVKTIWYAVRHDRRYDMGMGHGLTGGTLYAPDGRKIYEWLDGDKIPLEDTEVSVHTYKGIQRKAQELGMDWKNLTTGDVSQMVKRGDLMKIKNCGMRSFKEIHEILEKTCGVDHVVSSQLSVAMGNILNRITLW